ncbi:TIR-like protein FxsC [Streptomyces sp. FH025]|uniref:TIR-like protein FxsC n=1 Tax=Streptomyces sp. FH025 TaxID=2815937 RepID=UPI001A9E09B2|nr:TIR-like protein FxsC [Streptomyces sp. FH025]MBO1416971.1 TIR domain-containing protein [Streptomyces sp. FH025]
MEPYFFFSYARRDHLTGGAFVDQFFHDLKDELARIEPAVGTGELGYRDTERLRVGDDWEQQLSGTVASCRSMVALYSPAYFGSPYCGKEWTAFHERVRRHRELTGEAVPALIPVLWEPPPEELPVEVQRIQYVQHDMGEAYATGGLHALLRAEPYGPDYLRVVRVIAERVRDAALRPVTTLTTLDLGTVEGCFPLPAAEPAPTRTGLVRLFVAADRARPGPAAAQQPYRGGWYGPQPWDWAPYHPPTLPSLVARAQQVITRAGHITTLDEVGPGLVADLDRARENNQVSVLLVDPWSAGREPYGRALREFDGQNHPVTGVLVPTGTDDPPEGPARAHLWGGVRAVFPRNWLHRSGPEPLFRVHVTRERFERELLRAVTVAQNRLLDEEDADDPVAARASFGLGTETTAIPGLAIPAWPPLDVERLPPRPRRPPRSAPDQPREGDPQR